MTIGLNLLFLIPNKVGGTEYYARSFINELRRLDKNNNYVVFCSQALADTLEFKEKNWRKVVCSFPSSIRPARLVYEQFVFPFILKRERIDVLHSMGYFGPVVTPCRHIVTVHDANWRDHPEDTSLLENLVAKILIELNIFTAHTIVTDSQFSAGRLLRHFPFLKSKLHVISPGVDENFFSALKQAKKQKRHFPFPYFLTVSGYYPHKRLSSLLPFIRRISSKFPKHHHIIVGKNGKMERLLRPVFNGMSRVHTFKKVSLPMLANLYVNAEAIIHPSAYEGFGFPVYEAVAAGKRVFVGNTFLYEPGLLSAESLKQQYSLSAKMLVSLYELVP